MFQKQALTYFQNRRGLVMSQAPNGDFIHFKDLVSLFNLSISLRRPARFDIYDENAICRCTFSARDTQTL